MAEFIKHKIDNTAYDYLKYLVEHQDRDKIIEFLNPKNVDAGIVTTFQLQDFFQRGISPNFNTLNFNPIKALNLSEGDAFSVLATNVAVRYWLDGVSEPISELSQRIIDKITSTNSLIGSKTPKEIRETFFDFKAFLANAGDEETSATTVYATVIPAGYYLYNRLEIWKKNYSSSKTKEENLKVLEQAELIYINDNLGKSNDAEDESGESLDYLKEVFEKVYGSNSQKKLDELKLNASPSLNIGINNWSGFYRAFRPLDTNKPAIDPLTGTLEADQLDKIFLRIKNSGLLELASHASDIAEFGKRRLSSKDSAQKSAIDFMDIALDQAWLNQLIKTVQILSRDTVTLAMINVYFPSLVTFFFDALAVVGDYSNYGAGGGEEDTINNMNEFLKSLQTALGAKNGQDVFTLVYYGVDNEKNFKNTAERIREVLKNSPYRANVSPKTPNIFNFRLGAATFYVPPLSINVNTAFKTGSLTGGALRQKNTPKFNSGYKETSISIRLFFPNYEEIWGISIEDASRIQLKDNFVIDFSSDGSSDEKIDKFLSSLRGLVAAFKYSPFLPVKNSYLNSVHGITAVALSNMQVQTIPNFPFALAVDIELLNFNHKPLLPMVSDFNQAIHWGKYRQYIGKAAGSLSKYVNGEFLQKQSDSKSIDKTEVVQTSLVNEPELRRFNLNDENYLPLGEDVMVTNVVNEWTNGNNISFYIPIETQTKIFLPDMTSFRQNNEELMSDQNEDFWTRLLNYFGIDINTSADYGLSLSNTYNLAISGQVNRGVKNILKDSIDILVSGPSNGEVKEKVYAYLVKVFKIENKSLSQNEKKYIEDINSTNVPANIGLGTYIVNGQTLNNVTLESVKEYMKKISLSSKAYLDQIAQTMAEKRAKAQSEPIPLDGETGTLKYQNILKAVKDQISDAFSVLVYERFYSSGPIQALMEAIRSRSGSYQFREWEVPMLKVDLDPTAVTVTGVSVSMGNNLAKLQLQMQDEPTYQHIGGKDSYVNISMTVVGEKELAKIKRIFDHVNALARLEHASGVLGFMGIKNIITALCGIKYVMPSNYSVSTVPDYPHVYQVNLSLMDFDVFQQTRESLSSVQQKDFIDNFSAKRNPFLRIKQLWGAFNAYPDLPLEVRDKKNEIVGNLDPDFYFRSWEMFDKDVIYNVSSQTKPITFGPNEDSKEKSNKKFKIYSILSTFVREYSGLTQSEKKIKIKELSNTLIGLKISYNEFLETFREWVKDPQFRNSDTYDGMQKDMLVLTDYIDFVQGPDGPDPEIVNKISSAPYQVGDISSSSMEAYREIELALSGEFSPVDENYVSFLPEELNAHVQIAMMPIIDPSDPSKVPAIMQTAFGKNYGYIDTEKDGRFYLTIDGVKVNKGSKEFELNPIPINEHSDPANGTTQSAVPGLAPLSEYGSPVSHGENSGPEWSVGKNKPADTVNMHWEKMLVDTQYRDVSGRMLRAFPTYMLWLIDEGGYFAGVKLFDNFYGLQSIVDFSVVSSEDLLGDTLIFRVSNLYSKLTKPASSDIFGADSPLSSAISSGIGSILEGTLNKARNILAHMKNDYVVNVENIVLKPGVRVHLRGGYGSNPNSLQTLFNGTITQVEYGEVVTVTAQSDAIELGAVVNSTNKKGDSGKIDGGINTGLWLSEPRDLMVRLLSMGTSRFREGIANANRGLVFSENKFGIRHFGSMIYQPMSDAEEAKHYARIDSIADANNAVSEIDASKIASSALNMVGIGVQEFRHPVASLMGQLWSNFSSQRDMEIFKRNIYPGNGTGIAQFLGGDLGDGWTSVASITPEDQPNERLEYLGRLSDRSWNSLIANYDSGEAIATAVVEKNTASGASRNADGSATLVKNLALGGIGTTLAIAGGPITASVGVGIGLLGVLSGRGGNSIFRTLGLVSANNDDDMPGFDEVSFRAQTYMRTVWDLFQTCARLLPNYIVAIRPFEDRSTVFYGKPHWLYTSGVVPITTGYPGDEKAAELGIIPPQINDPDFDLMQIMNNVNKSITPYADAEAFLKSTEPIASMEALIDSQRFSQNIFKPAGYLKDNKVLINFNDQIFQEIKNEKTEIVAKLPKTKGNVTVGFHLPIGEAEQVVSNLEYNHAQIPQLPSRFRYPFFTARKNDPQFLDTYAFQYDKSKTGQMLEKGKGAEQDAIQSAENILDAVVGVYGEEFRDLFESDINFQINNSISGSLIQDLITNPIDFSKNLNELDTSPVTITMPTPEKNPNNQGNSDIFELDQNLGLDNLALYQEWKPPKTDIEEQFHIAMRWPYNVELGKEELVKKFKKWYFDDENASLYGTAADYQKMHVVVYNPSANRGQGAAVVCKPAYFLWGKNETVDISKASNYQTAYNETNIDAVVSPDAAYYLDILTTSEKLPVSKETSSGKYKVETGGYSPIPDVEECYFAFVPDTVPLGIAYSGFVGVKQFYIKKEGSSTEDSDAVVIGFGPWTSKNDAAEKLYARLKTNAGSTIQRYEPENADMVNPDYLRGGNFLNYYNLIKSSITDNAGEYTSDRLDLETIKYGQSLLAEEEENLLNRVQFPAVYSNQDSISIEARKLYDEDYDINTSVLAGNGRTLSEAQQIWDQFRYGYHTYDSVKNIFSNVFLLQWNDTAEFPESLKQIFSSKKLSEQFSIYKKFNSGSALDEFSLLFGQSNSNENEAVQQSRSEAIDFAQQKFVDAPIEDGGLIEYFNALTAERLTSLKNNLFTEENINKIYGEGYSVTGQNQEDLSDIIKTPQDLFYYVVGLFRQALWSDPYARAWLVLKPDRKLTFGEANDGENWSFKPVDKIFEAFIFPGNTYAKNKNEFLQLLFKNKSEGNSATNIVTKTFNSLGDFYDKSIGAVITSITNSLEALFGLFRLNMLQTGYGLSQSSVLAKQANILNKALNDSIYYQLGRPGSLLRAVDNPFTREYAEPVVEIREPFQRIHYLSSFSHILTNQIQQNSGVATTITAVSDGKYPVTVSLDKGAPADRQVENTVETGIYFDNLVGDGFFGFLHPILHPFETGRGISKNVTGAPDELSAKRIALSHLKESVKDIYSGEVVIIGNADIRPHDLVYLADVYERMYGIFEVEQVVHHFTSELGFVTSITPNAIVTVNDPAKWFMTSWIHSWLNVQTIRNDTRIYLDSLRAGNTGISMGGEISLDALGNSLSPQLIGGMQFTGGSSALIKDVVANDTATGFTGNSGLSDEIRKQATANSNGKVNASAIAGVIAGTVGTGAAVGAVGSGITSVAAGAAGTVAGVGVLPFAAAGTLLLGPLAWKGWKWVRNNLLDQHGCYIQYLTKNGQPMEAGLSYNQGMVVGRYHSISLLPGILGVRTKTRSAEGYQFIRTNDLFKSLGWTEKDTANFVRYASYENALVHAQVLGLAGLGPDKTGFEPFFKILCTLSKGTGLDGSGVTDGDTIYVEDVLNPDVKFTLRLDGINVSEKVQLGFTETTNKNGWIIGKNIQKINNKYYATLVTGGYKYDQNNEIVKDSLGYPVAVAVENNLIPTQNVGGQELAGDLVTVKNLGYPFDGINMKVIQPFSSSFSGPDFGEINKKYYFTYEIFEPEDITSEPGYYSEDDADKIISIDNKLIFNLDNEKQIKYYSETIPNDVVVQDFGSPGMLATQFVKTVLQNKTFVVRVKQSRTAPNKFQNEADFEPKGEDNRIKFLKEKFQRTLGTVFYNVSSDSIEKYKSVVFDFMKQNKFDLKIIKDKSNENSFAAHFFGNIGPGQSDLFFINFDKIFDKVYNLNLNVKDNDNIGGYEARLNADNNAPGASDSHTRTHIVYFYTFVELLKLRDLYFNSSKWPLMLWDEFYDDGTPVTLNWELITKNFGTSVYTKDLLNESESVIKSSEQMIAPQEY